MKLSVVLVPMLLSCIAAIGNAMVTIGQKKAGEYSNPFLFGALSLLLASLGLFVFVIFCQNKAPMVYLSKNYYWVLTSASGLILLNVFLYLLYRNYGSGYYTVYAVLAIISTSLITSIWIFGEKMNLYYLVSMICAVFTIFFFMKGKTL